MKLNLLPTTEKKSRQGKTAVVVGLLIVVCALALATGMTLYPRAQLEAARSGIDELKTQVTANDKKSKEADLIISKAAEVLRDTQLAQAMIAHNDKYPKLYEDLKPYIPPYYRIQSMSAQPLSNDPAAPMSQITLVGTLHGYQKYADLMLALMRFKDVITVTRAGYNLDDPVVPALVPEDQKGVMRKPGEAPVPQDGLERLAYFQAQAAAQPNGYLATGNYGSGTQDLRGPLPNDSVVTIVMRVARDLSVPLPADTLRSSGGTATTGAPGVPGFGGAPVATGRGD